MSEFTPPFTESTLSKTATPARVPPNFVPTLTEVVQLPKENAYPAVRPSTRQSGSSIASERILHRVMQKVDATLPLRLRQAVAEVAIAHAQALEPLLRAEIEWVVQRTVNEALAQELGENKV
jgi:hypothetical protein